MPASALMGLSLITLVVKKVGQGREDEGAEASSLALHLLKCTTFHKKLKKALG